MKQTLLVFVALFALNANASHIVTEGWFVTDPAKSRLKELKSNPELTIDHVARDGYEVWGPTGTKQWLNRLNFTTSPLETISAQIAADYPSYDQYAKTMQDIHARYPKFTQLSSIGKSAQGRDLLVMKISNDAAVDQKKPEFKYISSMHGDEITGRELMVSLINELLSNYGKDPRITKLVDATEIFIMPSMNPDGSMLRQRANAKGVDLNRDFPDFSTDDNQNTPDGRAVETQAVMKYEASRHFALSANFHGGAEVVNYPWDTIPDAHPQEALIKDFSTRYASGVDYMKNSSEFTGGITNGYAWYEVNGGMQDWSDHWYGDLQVTIELSGTKWPDYSDIAGFWSANRDSLIGYIEAIHQGAGFYVDGDETASGTVRITSDAGAVTTAPFAGGEFYTVLPVGIYTFDVMTKTGKTLSYKRSVLAGQMTRMAKLSTRLKQ